MGISSLLHNLSTKDPMPCDLGVKSKDLTQADLFALRYQNGPNLGALFVQEKWIDSSLFDGDKGGSSELAALESWGKHDLGDLQAKWEKHWSEFVGDQDFQFMKQRGVTCVRLPIGFWSLSNKHLLKHTPFEKYAKVYEHSWDHVVKVIEAAGKQQIGVLLDLHALPGGANGDEHSGTSSGKAELWEHSKLRDLAEDAYKDAVSKIKGLNNVVALQLVNEAPYGESKCPGFYLDAAYSIRSTNSSIPLVVSDGWDCGSLVDKIKKWNEKLTKSGNIGSTGFVVDTHVYRTFSDDDRNKSADEHIKAAPNSVNPDEDVDIIVGEWSCCLDENSWSKTHGDRGALEAEYGKAQLSCYEKLAGNFFWTYKFGQGNGGSWDWRTMSDQGVVLPRVEPGKGNYQAQYENAFGEHKSYWNGVDSKKDWEHWRFEDGFKQGWDDAEKFAEFDGSRPGLIAQLKTMRSAQHVKDKGGSDKTWVFGQAYVQGIRSRVSSS